MLCQWKTGNILSIIMTIPKQNQKSKWEQSGKNNNHSCILFLYEVQWKSNYFQFQRAKIKLWMNHV